jgi:hypothetical protein
LDHPRRQPLLRGYLLIALGATILIGVPVGLLMLLGAMKARLGFLDILVVGALVVASSRWGIARFQNGKQRVAAANDERAFDEHADFIFYLRGFVDDIVASQTLGEPTVWQDAFANLVRLPLTEEEHLARALGAYCPVAAIGRPGEDLPILGATRRYVDDESWQQRVRELMQRARLVVLRLGPHNGLAWELETALTELPPEKLVVLVPCDSSLLGAWTILEQSLERSLPYLIETVEPAAQLGTLRGLVFLTRQGEPVVYQLTNRVVRKRLSRYPLADAVDDAFGPLLARVGVHRLRRPMLFRRGAALLVDLMLLTGLSTLTRAASITSNWDAVRAVIGADLAAGVEPTGRSAIDSASELIALLLFGAYLIACEIFFRRTVGKSATRLEVTPARKGWFMGRVTVRNVVKIATLATILLPSPFGPLVFLSLCIVPLLVWRVPLHDLVSGTEVIGRSSIRNVLN